MNIVYECCNIQVWFAIRYFHFLYVNESIRLYGLGFSFVCVCVCDEKRPTPKITCLCVCNLLGAWRPHNDRSLTHTERGWVAAGCMHSKESNAYPHPKSVYILWSIVSQTQVGARNVQCVELVYVPLIGRHTFAPIS